MKFLTATTTSKFLLLTVACFASGCAAFRPIEGVPARFLAPELRATSRSNDSTIDLSLLAQKPPRQHFVDGGDVLGIYIEGILGRIGEAPPINVPTTPDLPPSIGYPITVRDDGTISLPVVGSINVRGMTIRQVEEHLRRIYTIEKRILKRGADRIIVSLQRPRQVRILVLRQETGGPGGTEFAQGLSLNLGQSKRGNGQVVHLPIYKNDVLHALARTGGLPGLDAENMIYIVRRVQKNRGGHGQYPPMMNQPMQNVPAASGHFSSNSYKSRSGVQLVGYHPSANSRPSVEQVAAFNAPPSSRQTTGFYSDRFEVAENIQSNSLYQGNPNYQRSGIPKGVNSGVPDSFGNQPGNQFTIAPVTASNFGKKNPLNELRAGMEPPVAPVQNYFAGAESIPVSVPRSRYQQTAMQQEVILQQESPTGFYEPKLTQPGLPAPASQFPMNSPLNMPVQSPALGSYGNGFSPQATQPQFQQQSLPPQSFGEANFGLYIDHNDPVLSGIDFGGSGIGGDPTMNNHKVIKIPVRLKPGEQPSIRPEDIILEDGDIVFIESRDTEIFYTGGLLGGGQYTLPRDYDLDILGAIAIAQGASQQQSVRQIGGASALNGDVTISASNVIILRRMPNGSQVPIKVDLYRALTDPAERILIQPGDIVMLRYKLHEAIGAFVERNLLESALFGVAAGQLGGNGGG